MQTGLTAFTVPSTAEIDILDITDQVRAQVVASGVTSGQACVFIGGSTGSVTTIEYEPGAVADLRRTLETIAPPGADYRHHLTWGDGNGYAHVLAALLGPSRTFPIQDGDLPLGTWQQIVLVDLDNKSRRRKVWVQCLGE